MPHLYNGMSTTAGALLYPNPGRLLPGMTSVSGFGALALYGLPHLMDAHDTVLISPTLHAKKRGSTFEPAFVRKQLEPGELWQMECRDELITVAAPPVAVVQALQLIRSRQCAWPVIASEDDEVFVRAALTPETIAVAGKGRVNNRWPVSSG